MILSLDGLVLVLVLVYMRLGTDWQGLRWNGGDCWEGLLWEGRLARGGTSWNELQSNTHEVQNLSPSESRPVNVTCNVPTQFCTSKSISMRKRWNVHWRSGDRDFLDIQTVAS